MTAGTSSSSVVGAGRTSAAGPDRATPAVRRSLITPRNMPYILVAPAVLAFLIFKVYPILDSLWLSLTTRIDGVDVFAGAHNYQRILADPLFWTALGNTALILVVQVPIMLSLAMLLAVGLNSTYVRLRSVWRLGVFMPAVTGLVAYGILFGLILNRDFGLLNYALEAVGLDPVNWLGDPFWARISIVLALTWHYTGYNAVIYLAGLQGINGDLYEAAALDGAGRIRQFWRITVPLMRPMILFTVVLSTIGTLQLFDEPYVLTSGGPDNATLTISLYLYQNGFRFFDFGYASALAWVLVVIVSVLGLLQLKVLGERSR